MSHNENITYKIANQAYWNWYNKNLDEIEKDVNNYIDIEIEKLNKPDKPGVIQKALNFFGN